MDERPIAETNGADMATTDSTFLKLPVENMLMILHNIQDPVSILVMRQTCRQLRSLCEDATLKYRVPTATSQREATPWFDDPYLKLICSLPDGELAKYEQLLWQDRMCTACTELRRDTAAYELAVQRMYRPMLCSGCVDYHPSYLFSYKERRKASTERVCIGRQGHFRLCEHIKFNYDVAQGLVPRGFEFCKICKLPEVRHREFTIGHNPHTNICFNTSFFGKDKVGVYCDIKVFRSWFRPPICQIKDVIKILTDFMSLHPSIATCNHAGTSDFPYHIRRMLLKADAQPANSYFRHNHFYYNARSTCTFPDCGFSINLWADKWTIRIYTIHEVLAIYATTPDWLCALDPRSYLSKRDQLTRGFIWCHDPACTAMKSGRPRHALFMQNISPRKETGTPSSSTSFSSCDQLFSQASSRAPAWFQFLLPLGCSR